MSTNTYGNVESVDYEVTQKKQNDAANNSTDATRLQPSNVLGALDIDNISDWCTIVDESGGGWVIPEEDNETILTMYLKFDGDGSDASGHSNTATLGGNAGYAAGQIGKALNIPDNTSFATVPDSTTNRRVSQFSIAGIAQVNDLNNSKGLIAKTDASLNNGYSIWVRTDGFIYFSVLDTGSEYRVRSSVVIPFGIPFCFGMSYNSTGNVVKGYLQGIPYTTSASFGATFPASAGLHLARSGVGSRPLTSGKLDEIRYYNSLLTDQDFLNIFNNAQCRIASRYRYAFASSQGECS
jgi:hypothetical protein